MIFDILFYQKGGTIFFFFFLIFIYYIAPLYNISYFNEYVQSLLDTMVLIVSIPA